MRRIIFSIVLAFAISGCIPDEKDPGATSDAGKLNGNYYASALGNVALQIQNAVVGDAAWFTALTGSMQLNLASMGIDTNTIAAPLKSHVCPTGTGTEVIQLTWIDGRDSAGKFSVKGVGSDTGLMMGALRSRVAADQVGTFNGSTNLQMASGEAMAIPSSCSAVSIPLGSPVLAFRISRPAAPVAEMARTEYRTVACGLDSRGMQQRGTMVQKRVVRYTAEGAITPADAATGWSAENMGSCISDAIVTATSNTTSQGGSVALNAFADIAAQGLKATLEAQLQMDCATSNITSDVMKKNGETVQRVQKNKNIDTCTKATAGASSNTINDGVVSNLADVRNVCPRNSSVVKSLLQVSTGTLTSVYGGIANIERVVEKVTLNSDNTNRGERARWRGTAINCSGTDTYTVNCGNVPGQPTGPDVSSAGGKWNYRDLAASANNWDWSNNIFGICWGIFGSCEYVNGGGAYTLNWNYFNSKETLHGAASTTRAYRALSATTWTDPYQYFIPNFNVPPSTLGWTVPASTNACLIRTREIQLTCPLNYDASKLAGWNPYELSPTTGFFTTILPGGSYPTGGMDGYAGMFYNQLRINGHGVGLTWVNRKSCNIKGCDSWQVYAGPGTDAYIKSWTYSDANSVNGATSSVQTIMMNKDGQLADYKPAIVSGPQLRYKGSYTTPLHCGRIEHRSFSWPVIAAYLVCGGKGGCHWEFWPTWTTVTEIVTREWSGENATIGTWSRPNVRYSSPYGTWGSIGAIPNPLTTW